MIISIGSDHAGYTLKEELVKYLESNNYQIIDEGTNSSESVDYPDFAIKVCQDVCEKKADFGILVCYTGIGMSITANKFLGIRASLVQNIEDTILTREHNNANVLCLGAKNTNSELAKELANTFINTSFLGGRHERRVNKIIEIEKQYEKR